MTVAVETITEARCVVRGTGSRRGRHVWAEPGTTSARHLRYARTILEGGDDAVGLSTGPHEIGLVVLGGTAEVDADGGPYVLGRYDALYVPRQSVVQIRPCAQGCDVAEVGAPVSGRHPVQLVRFADVRQDASLHFQAGQAPAHRELNVLIGKNVRAGRIMAGVTFSAPGNWTSWPPHEHAQMLEEAYLFIDMPSPAWGVQLVYTDPGQPELVAVVRDGDWVLMPQGYHPNVAAPGGSINFLWMMAAVREGDDRQFGVVNVQPEYAQGGSGLDAGRAK
ncbi:MAG TPA: 5-deoxy-glucuronate isomerase [Vicinamibacteria bacterium]|nr:5-deoxy-glucuronate isomerase [Vicinamibacteria bacterium]